MMLNFMADMSARPTLDVKQNVEGADMGAKIGGTLGEKLLQLRRSMAPRPTQAKVAAAVGIKRPTLSGLESDKSLPSRETLVRLAQFYGVSVDELYSGPGSPSERQYTKDPDEAALLAFWRGLDEDGKRLMLLLLSRGRPRE